MGRGAGRSFVALGALGGIVEFGGTAVAVLGLDTLARCYLAGFANSRTARPVVCMEAIAGVGFHLFVPVALLVAILVGSTVLGALQVVHSLGDAKRLDRILGPRITTVPPELTRAAQDAEVSEFEVRENVEPYGVCLGILHPRVVVSTALVGFLTHDEVVAVIAHEERHRRRRAPLRRLVALATTRALFYLPLLNDLSAAHVIEEEVVADEQSCALVGAHALVRALEKMSDACRMSRAASSAFGDLSTLSFRLKAIREGRVSRPSLRRLSAAASASSLCLLVLLALWMPLAGIR